MTEKYCVPSMSAVRLKCSEGNVRIVLATKGRITPVIQVIHGLCPKIRYMSRRRGFLYADALLKPFLFVQTVLST